MLANLMPTLCWMAAADGWIFCYSVMEAWTASIRTGEPFEMTFPLRSAAGTYRPSLTRVTPVRDTSGRVVRWLGVNTDIGDERAALEMREQFMAVLGHDLRNPLQALTAGLTVLRKTATDDKSQRMLAMMGQSTARMGALIDDVMDMARARLGVGIQANGGEPISPEEQARLFQPFFRGAVRPSRQGLGLGLYIAHEIGGSPRVAECCLNSGADMLYVSNARKIRGAREFTWFLYRWRTALG